MQFAYKLREIVTSIRGAGGITILIICLMPLILFMSLAAIDFNMYLATKTQLQNALDVAALDALSKSTIDKYRADKILKLITNESSSNCFTKKLEEGIKNNFRPKGAITRSGNTFTFTPGFSFTPDPVKLEVEFKPSGGGAEYKEGSELSESYAIDQDIYLTLTAHVNLPTMSKLYKFMGGLEIFKTEVTVKSAVRGIRVKGSEDFEEKDWEIY